MWLPSTVVAWPFLRQEKRVKRVREMYYAPKTVRSRGQTTRALVAFDHTPVMRITVNLHSEGGFVICPVGKDTEE